MICESEGYSTTPNIESLHGTKNIEGAEMKLQCWESIERHFKHFLWPRTAVFLLFELLEILWFFQISGEIVLELA